MITFVCVEHGDYLGRGKQYVEVLRNMLARHVSEPYHLVVLTDEPYRHADVEDQHAEVDVQLLKTRLSGWWTKVHLFEPGRFSGRVVYFDLDTIIVGSLAKLVQSKGILHLKNWGWVKNDFGSGVMVWDAGEHSEIWTEFYRDVPINFRGDQDWMTSLGGWAALPVDLCKSYRYHSVKAPPKGASVVCFHGVPKPHDVTTGWVPKEWR